MSEAVKLLGADNSGKPRQAYADKLAAMDDAAFVDEAQTSIWLSAYAANNRRSDYHWRAETCFKEAERRGKPGLYERAYARAAASA